MVRIIAWMEGLEKISTTALLTACYRRSQGSSPIYRIHVYQICVRLFPLGQFALCSYQWFCLVIFDRAWRGEKKSALGIVCRNSPAWGICLTVDFLFPLPPFSLNQFSFPLTCSPSLSLSPPPPVLKTLIEPHWQCVNMKVETVTFRPHMNI